MFCGLFLSLRAQKGFDRIISASSARFVRFWNLNFLAEIATYLVRGVCTLMHRRIWFHVASLFEQPLKTDRNFFIAPKNRAQKVGSMGTPRPKTTSKWRRIFVQIAETKSADPGIFSRKKAWSAVFGCWFWGQILSVFG